jgi:hypothetical protein
MVTFMQIIVSTKACEGHLNRRLHEITTLLQKAYSKTEDDRAAGKADGRQITDEKRDDRK